VRLVPSHGEIERFLDGRGLSADIESSWRRSLRAGVSPGVDLSRLTVAEIDRQSRLAIAAAPVLDQLATDFDGTTYCMALADHAARVIERRFGEVRVGDALDSVGIVPGARYDEEISGTNSIATVVALGRPLTVTGAEHLVESLRGFACYGHPIMNPITRQLEGVLDISCLVGEANPLVKPLLVRSVRSIEERLFEGACRADQRMLEVYRAATSHRTRPVLVLGDTAVLANPAAMELLDASDHAAFHALATDTPLLGRHVTTLTLASGTQVRVEMERIDTTGRVLFEFDRVKERKLVAAGRMARGLPLDRLAAARAARTSVAIVGEPGVGRTSTALELAAGAPVQVVECGEVGELGRAGWAALLEAGAAGLVLLEDLQELAPAQAKILHSLLDEKPVWLAVTSVPAASPAGEHAALLARCGTRIELPPLRSRTTELGRLLRELTRRVAPEVSVRFTPKAIEALASNAWPGNLKELEGVVRTVLSRRSSGDITPQDLPSQYRRGTRSRNLTTVQQLEHDAIITALIACRGNKLAAAERLGMSRSTLYRRIRTLGVPEQD
jgi:transcriptional regulator of acetoin/glycerol metabolism